MSQRAKDRALYPNDEEERETRVLDVLLARIAREMDAMVRLIDAAQGDSLAYSTIHDAIMAFLTRLAEAEASVNRLLAMPELTPSGRTNTLCAKASLELSNTAMTIAVGRCDMDFDM